MSSRARRKCLSAAAQSQSPSAAALARTACPSASERIELDGPQGRVLLLGKGLRRGHEGVEGELGVAPADLGERGGESAVDPDGLFEIADGGLEVRLDDGSPQGGLTSHVGFIGGGDDGTPGIAKPLRLPGGEDGPDLQRQLPDDLPLKVEDIRHLPLEVLGPETPLGRGPVQAGRDPDPAPAPDDAAVDEGLDVELPPDLRRGPWANP